MESKRVQLLPTPVSEALFRARVVRMGVVAPAATTATAMEGLLSRGICTKAAQQWLSHMSLPRFQGQCLESCFYTDPMKTNDHNECLVYATPLQR